MATIVVTTQYSAGTMTQIELPSGLTFDDIADDHYVKWGVFNFRRKGTEDWMKVDLNEDIEVDTKRPESHGIQRSYDSLPEDDD